MLKESETIINISRAIKYALKYRTIDEVTVALATGKNVVSVIETKLDGLIDVAGRARLSSYTILEEEYIDILDIVLSWKKKNPSSIMTEFEASAMIKAHREGKSFDEVLRAIEGVSETVARLKQLGATDEVISLIQKSEGMDGLNRLDDLLYRGYQSDDIATLSKYGISTAEYEAKGISYSRVVENISRMLNTNDSCVELYRAVGANEYADLTSSRRFNPGTGATYNGKQFGFDFDEILRLTDDLPNTVAIFKVKIPKEIFTKLDFTPVDVINLKLGSLTVEEGDLLNLLNDNIKELVQVF